MPWPRLLADVVALVHAAWVLFIVVGQAAILVGLARGWGWVRNVGFRSIHLAMIGYVVFEAMVGLDCPLTVWESELRRRAGERAYSAGFIGDWVHRLMFFRAPGWVFNVVYGLFGAVVLATFALAPPRRRRTTRAGLAAPRPGPQNGPAAEKTGSGASSQASESPPS